MRLDLIAFAIEELTSTFFFETLQSRDGSAVDKLVDGLDEVLMQLLGLVVLVRPVGGLGSGVNHVDILVKLDEGFNGVLAELESNLIAQNHVHMDHICLDMYELVVEERLDQGIRVLLHFGLGRLGQHQRCQGPDGVFVRQELGQTSLVLHDAVERTLDTVDSLQCLREPLLWLAGSEDDVD